MSVEKASQTVWTKDRGAVEAKPEAGGLMSWRHAVAKAGMVGVAISLTRV